MKFKLLTAAALMAASVAAQAAVTTTSLVGTPGATVIDFSDFDGLINTTGTVDLGQGVTFSGATDAELGPVARDLVDNGLWTFGLNGFVASGSDGVMTFSFNGLKSGVTAFVSHEGGATLLVEALGAGANVLESTTVTFAAPSGIFAYDEGMTIGFSRASSDIMGLRITGVGAVADNVAAVPEPGAIGLVLAGLAVVGAFSRRRSA